MIINYDFEESEKGLGLKDLKAIYYKIKTNITSNYGKWVMIWVWYKYNRIQDKIE